MIFSSERNLGDGQWHCPFTEEWLKETKRIVTVCTTMKAQEKERSWMKFLDEPQDARGLPMSWCKEYEERHKDWPTDCLATWDYAEIPEVVATNGKEDWPYKMKR